MFSFNHTILVMSVGSQSVRDAKGGYKSRERSVFTFPIRLNTLNFGVKLQFNHGLESLENRNGFNLALYRKYPGIPRESINEGDIIFITRI